MFLEMILNGTKQTVPQIIIQCFLYILCALIVYTVHDAAQAHCAKRLGATIDKKHGFIAQLKDVPNIFSTAMLLIFGIAFKKRVEYKEDLGRKKTFLVAVSGPFWCFIGASVSYILLQLTYLLEKTVLSGLVEILVPFFACLFAVFVLVTVFSLLFIVPPFDGGYAISTIVPFDAREKFLNMGQYVSIFIVIIATVVLARIEFPQMIIEKVNYGFNFIWQHLGSLIINGRF